MCNTQPKDRYDGQTAQMKTKILTFTLSAFILLLYSFDLPKNWIVAGSSPKSYKMGIDVGAGQEGKNAATIQSKKDNIKGFGTLMQNSNPDKYLGKRVRMTGYIKSESVQGWAGLWFRVDQKDSDYAISFDNMKDRAVMGTTDWTKYEIVLDIPLNATNLAYGALLSGNGKIWFDNLSFEIVDKSVPTTGEGSQDLMPLSEPANLSFEE